MSLASCKGSKEWVSAFFNRLCTDTTAQRGSSSWDYQQWLKINCCFWVVFFLHLQISMHNDAQEIIMIMWTVYTCKPQEYTHMVFEFIEGVPLQIVKFTCTLYLVEIVVTWVCLLAVLHLYPVRSEERYDQNLK